MTVAGVKVPVRQLLFLCLDVSLGVGLGLKVQGLRSEDAKRTLTLRTGLLGAYEFNKDSEGNPDLQCTPKSKLSTEGV